MKQTQRISLLISIVYLSGCFNEEDPIQPYPRGDVNQNKIEMGASYADQYFFSLDQNKVVARVNKTVWDLAYSSEEGNSTIRLNTGKNMYVAVTSALNLTEVMDTTGLTFKWDWSNGRDDSTSLNGWTDSDKVFVIDLGMDETNTHLGFVKAKLSLKNEVLQMNYSLLAGGPEYQAELKKDDEYNQVFYSFQTHSNVQVEPVKTEFDLVFRQYIYYFEPEDLAYLVVGCLINSNDTRVARIFDKNFEDIVVKDTLNYGFMDNADVIGYDWKEFKLSDGVYIVYADQNYLLEDSKGFLYKLHFTDFYSSTGEKGYPTLEFKRL
jgi:HmuY protein